MNKLNDMQLKMKALAALEHGVIPNGTLAFHAVRLVEQGTHLMPREVPVDGEYDTPIEALAAAADVLGLDSDAAILVLTEEEKAVLIEALSQYTASLAGWFNADASEEAARLRRCGELAKSVLHRLTKK